jgi:hypothetical protein
MPSERWRWRRLTIAGWETPPKEVETVAQRIWAATVKRGTAARGNKRSARVASARGRYDIQVFRVKKY